MPSPMSISYVHLLSYVSLTSFFANSNVLKESPPADLIRLNTLQNDHPIPNIPGVWRFSSLFFLDFVLFQVFVFFFFFHILYV